MSEPSPTPRERLDSRPVVTLQPEDVGVLYQLEDRFGDGAIIRLGPGTFVLSKTVRLPSNTDLIGSRGGTTHIVLAPHSDCHIFTNARPGPDAATHDMRVENLVVDGNGPQQSRPDGHARLTFACGFYMNGARDLVFRNLRMTSIRQTALHFAHAHGVLVTEVEASHLGWSGASSV